MLPEKVNQSSTQLFEGCYPLNLPSRQFLLRSVKPALRKALQKLGLGPKIFCHGQKRDYLSRDSQVCERCD